MRIANVLSLALFSLMLFWVTVIFAQPHIVWQKSFGGSDDDWAQSIQQTADGGFIVAGMSESNNGDISGNHGYSDCWIVKLNSSGSIVWQKCLGGSNWDCAYSIQQTLDGGFIMAGVSCSNDGDVSGNHGGCDCWIVKLDSYGNIVWQKCLGGSYWDGAYSIQQTLDGGFIVAGVSNSNDGDVSGNHGYADYWVVKLNSSGDIEWQKCLGGSFWDYALSVQQTSDGGYIVAGVSCSNNGDVSGNHGGSDYWIVKLDSYGSMVWQKCLGGSGYDIAYSVQQTTDGGFIVAGYSNSNDGDVSGNHGSSDYWVARLNSSGNIIWQKCLGGSGYDIAHSIQQTTDGGFIVTGWSSSNDGDVIGHHPGEYWDYCESDVPNYYGMRDSIWNEYSDYWLVKLNSAGSIVWQKCLGGSSWDRAYCVQQTFDGGFIVAGVSESNDGDVNVNYGDYDYWLVKLSPVGVIENMIVPEQFAVSVFPNPFNSSCVIAAPSGAKIEIYDIKGNVVFTSYVHRSISCQKKVEQQRIEQFIWTPNENIPSGIYLVCAKVNDKISEKRVIYIK
ncbi:T9SS type A sorting domain-containing protein [bacterium]|nr:T9SS type A sorting domain-containing protein [bacterium]